MSTKSRSAWGCGTTISRSVCIAGTQLGCAAGTDPVPNTAIRGRRKLGILDSEQPRFRSGNESGRPGRPSRSPSLAVSPRLSKVFSRSSTRHRQSASVESLRSAGATIDNRPALAVAQLNAKKKPPEAASCWPLGLSAVAARGRLLTTDDQVGLGCFLGSLTLFIRSFLRSVAATVEPSSLRNVPASESPFLFL